MKKSGKVFIITGMSGAGKSQALKFFEDFGFYCVVFFFKQKTAYEIDM